ncbi:MAG: FHA domain-containing protein [Pseudoxanthomonas sp.]
MEKLHIQFKQGQQADWPLEPGVHRLARGADGVAGFGGMPGTPLVQFCVDKRGLWLQVADGNGNGVHVNGRPVRRMALLRAGDSIHVDGAEMQVRGQARPLPAHAGASVREEVDDPCMVLRGVGGPLHGRSFPLTRPHDVGSAEDADIRIAEAGVAPRQLRLQRQGRQVWLTGLTAERSAWVNGVAVRDALLSAGDQVVFTPQARFVLDVPWPAAATLAPLPEAEIDDAPEIEVMSLRQSAKRWPWLLLAALLLGAGLSALLLFGRG